VCAECDREIGKAEEQLARCGMEAIFKAHLRITGKRKHRPSFPFRRRYAGQGPIALKTRLPGTDYDVFVEPMGDGGNVRPVPQLVLLKPNGEHDCIRLPDPMNTTANYMRIALQKCPLKGDLRVETVALTNEEVDHIFELLKSIGAFLNEESTPSDVASPEKQFYPNMLVEGSVAVDARYFRAVAKIGFHHFLQYSGYFSGREACFTALREFIRYGKGKIERFVSQQRGHLVSDLGRGFRPSYYGHFVIGDFNKNTATAYAQFFIGRDNDPPYYRAALGKNCLLILLDSTVFGHFYSYYPPEERSQYTGEIQALGATHRIAMPDRFRVDYPKED